MEFPDFGSAINWKKKTERSIILGGYILGVITFVFVVAYLVKSAQLS
jgi:hypothetical protein